MRRAAPRSCPHCCGSIVCGGRNLPFRINSRYDAPIEKNHVHPGSHPVSLKGKTLFITGGSRGIGLAIAVRAARDGANVVVAAKTGEPHAKLPGTIYSAAEEIEKAGGKALPKNGRASGRERGCQYVENSVVDEQ